MNNKTDNLIDRLELLPHPEGGFGPPPNNSSKAAEELLENN